MEEPAIESLAAPSVADLLGVALALDEDESLDPTARRKRDRALGIACEKAGVEDPAKRLVAWLEAREGTASGAASRLRGSLRLLGSGLAVMGFLLGWATSLGALAFEAGAGRINVVLVLALLVVAPVALLLLSLLAAIPSEQARWIPGAEPLTAGLRRLSTGRLALRLISAERRDVLAVLFGRGVGQARLYATTRRWLLLALSQSAALAFGLGALVGTLGLVVFTDLAFGWSTTLELDAAAFHRAVAWVSRPWSPFWSAALPSRELVEATRFFRVSPSVPEAVDPALYGRWWPFVVAAIVVYAVLPRALWAGFCSWRLRRAVRTALLQTPGASELLGRLQSPLIEMQQEHPSDAAHPLEAPRAVDWSTSEPPPGTVVCWAEAADARELKGLFPGEAPTAFRAGGNAALADDRSAIEAARRAQGSVAAVVRGYEPPVADFLDFLRELRAALGDGRRVDVIPLGADEAHLRVWSGALASLGDPWLRARRPPVAVS